MVACYNFYMAKRRTKKQKLRTKVREQEKSLMPEYKFDSDEIGKKGEKINTEELVEKKLIVGDLVKTVVISIVILGLLALAYYRLG